MENTRITEANLHRTIILKKFKQCRFCGQFKLLNKFNKSDRGKNGIFPECKKCVNIKRRASKKGLKVEIQFRPQLYLQGYKQCTKCKKVLTANSFVKNNGNCVLGLGLDSTCKQCHHEYQITYEQSEKGKLQRKINQKKRMATDKFKVWRKEYRQQSHIKEYEAEYQRKRYKSDKYKKLMLEKRSDPKYIKKQRAYYKKRRDENVNVRLNASISGGIYRSLVYGKNGKHWENIVGYTLEQLKKHLKKQFKLGMTWDTYGGKNGWQIDHITPKSVFNFETPENPDFQRCWCLKNLQPLWAIDNYEKHTKIDTPVQMSLLLASKKGDKAGATIYR